MSNLKNERTLSARFDVGGQCYTVHNPDNPYERELELDMRKYVRLYGVPIKIIIRVDEDVFFTVYRDKRVYKQRDGGTTAVGWDYKSTMRKEQKEPFLQGA